MTDNERETLVLLEELLRRKAVRLMSQEETGVSSEEFERIVEALIEMNSLEKEGLRVSSSMALVQYV